MLRQIQDGSLKIGDRKAFRWAADGLQGILGRGTTGERFQQLMEANYQVWKNKIFSHLNMAKSFEDVENTPAAIDEENRGRYEAITQSMTNPNDLENQKISFGAGSTFATMAGGGKRVYFFKSADDEYAYQQAYGQGDLRLILTHEIESFAKNTAIVEKFGPDAVQTFNKMVGSVAKNGPHGFKTKGRLVLEQKVFANLTSDASSPVNYKSAKIHSTIRSFIAAAKLGLVVPRSFADVASTAMNEKIRGKNVISGYLESIGFALKAVKNIPHDIFNERPRVSANQKKLADSLGSYIHSWVGSINRFGTETLGDGLATKVNHAIMQVTDLKGWDFNHTHGQNASFARDLALAKDTPWKDLNVGTSTILGKYNLEEKEWNLLRSLPLLKEVDGKTYMAPDGIRQATIAQLAAYKGIPAKLLSSSAATQLRDSLEMRLLGMYHDRANYSIQYTQPGDQALLNWGLKPGSASGELVRYATMFKGFSVGYVRRALGQWINANPYSSRIGWTSLAQLLGGTMVFSGIGNAAADLAGGKKPDIESVGFWLDAAGPMLGFYNDMLEAANTKYGKSFAANMLGPGAALLDKDLSAVASMFQGAPKRPRETHIMGQLSTRNFINTVRGNIPYQNLIFTKSIVDYMISSQLLDRLDPNAVKQMVKEANQNNTPYIVNPS